MKKIIFLALCSILCVSLFSSCGDDSDPASTSPQNGQITPEGTVTFNDGVLPTGTVIALSASSTVKPGENVTLTSSLALTEAYVSIQGQSGYYTCTPTLVSSRATASTYTYTLPFTIKQETTLSITAKTESGEITAPLTVKVTSSAANTPTLTVSGTATIDASGTVTTNTITVAATNTDWNVAVKSGSEWLTCSKNENGVSLTATQNTTSSARVAVIAITTTADANLSYSIEITQQGPTNMANLLPGKFSVSETKQVQFTRSNLYWDGSAFKFEANQTDYDRGTPKSYSEWIEWIYTTTHVSHFYWTKTDAASYAEACSDGRCTTSDKFFADGSDAAHKLTVDGTNDLRVLASAEWSYLINRRTNCNKLYKYGVTVTNSGTCYDNCLIIAPDDFAGTLQSSYTLEEVNKAGLVCLPAAGNRDGSSLHYVGSYGNYWSYTPHSYLELYAYCLDFYSDNIIPACQTTRNYGHSLRLVRDIR